MKYINTFFSIFSLHSLQAQSKKVNLKTGIGVGSGIRLSLSATRDLNLTNNIRIGAQIGKGRYTLGFPVSEFRTTFIMGRAAFHLRDLLLKFQSLMEGIDYYIRLSFGLCQLKLKHENMFLNKILIRLYTGFGHLPKSRFRTYIKVG